MKKIICIVLILVIILCLSFSLLTGLTGCALEDDGKIKVVVTIFPIYDWVMEILGDRADEANVTLLLDSGADLHSYQPSVEDMVSVAQADLFIYVGGESDKWVGDALKNATNKDMRVMDLLSLLGDKAQVEEIVEGMEHEEEAEEEESAEYDEHVWLSLKNASFYVSQIAKELSAMDSANAGTYSANSAAYVAKINALDESYATLVASSPRDTLLFGDRFPFRYLVEDYGLKYYAAFVGCSAETNASFETMQFLINKANELSVKVILKIENSSSEIAEGITEGSDVKNQTIMILDSLQSASEKEYAEGRTYLSVMTANLDVLRAALAA